jgi:hypothetical protein
VFWANGSRVIGANMGGKFLVALQLKVPHHFIERVTRERSRSLKPPGAFGATKTMKTAFFDPDELASRSHL